MAAETKDNLSKIFRNGNDFKFKTVNWTTKKLKKIITKLRKERKITLESAKIDIEELKKIKFDI